MNCSTIFPIQIENAELVRRLSLHKLSAKPMPMNQHLSTNEILADFKHFHINLHTVGIFLDYTCEGSEQLLATVGGIQYSHNIQYRYNQWTWTWTAARQKRTCQWRKYSIYFPLVWQVFFNQIQMANLWAWNGGKRWISSY